jgi:hypothetical protein
MQAAQALDGVGNAVDSTAQEEGAALQEQMPPVEVGGDGSGGSAVSTAPEETEATATEEAPAGPSQPTPEAEPLPEPGPAPTAAIATPSVADTEQGAVSREDATRVAGAVSAMPTSDPGLNVSAGQPPAVAKEGDADPGRIQEQRAALDATVAEQRARGAADAAAPGGEQNVRDRSPREALQAPRLAAPAAGGAGGAAPAEEEGVGIIAEQKQGAEVRAAMAQAQGEMAAKRAEHQGKVAEEKAKSSAEITALKQENASQQQAEKAKVEGEVGKARGAWTAEQNAELARTNEKARGEISKGNEKISQEEKQANEKAAQHISAGESEAAQHREKAEKEAAARKQEAERQKEEDSGGIFGWIASKVTAFFEALKNAITKVFDAAKKLVKAAIDKAKQLAVAVIEKARQAVVGLIKAVGAALVALGDVLLAAFPGLRRKWRALIAAKVKAAEDAVNRLADGLKKGVTRLLDLVGKAFTFLLDAYSKAMVAVLDVAKGVAMAAIKAAKAYAAAIGTFVVLIKDIAAAPGRWIANLGAAVMEGIRNNLWTAFKTSVKSWFDSKLEQVLGVGTMIWNVLKQGGISFQQVGQMAFQALKAAIPSALIALLIEKLVAMIVPAAGAVMAIIEGLQAAWPAVQRVIAAAGLFVVFLKAVKAGGAGPQFAGALAAGAVVVIDFVANWLLRKLRGPASKVGSKVKVIAQKIMARVKKALKKVGGALKKGAKWVKGKAKGLKKKFDGMKAKRKAKKDAKKKGKEDPSKKKQDKDKAKRSRLERAERELTPKLDALFRKGVGKLRLRMTLGWWRIRYGLSSLTFDGSGVVAKINPTSRFTRAEVLQLAARLEPVLERVEQKFLAALQKSGGRLPEQHGALKPSEHRSTGSVVNQMVEDKRLIEDIVYGNRSLTWGKGKQWSDVVTTPSGSPLRATQRREGSFVAPTEFKVGHGTADYPALQRRVPGLGLSAETVSTLSLETVRAPGMLPVFAISHQIATLEAQAKGILPGSMADQAMAQRMLGAHNPMENKGSGRAGVQDFWGWGKPDPADTSKSLTKKEQEKAQETQVAREQRRSKIWRVFSHLRRVVRQNKSLVGQAPALEQVVKDFENYAKMGHPEQAHDPEALQQALDNLERSLLAFMLSLR